MSAELPWFPMFVSDWLTSDAVTLMLPEQEGAFVRLLVVAWGKGHSEPSLPADDASLAILSRLGKRWAKLGPLVRAQFKDEGGRLTNERLSMVWYEAQEKHASAVHRGQQGAKTRAAKRKQNSSSASSSAKPQVEHREEQESVSEPNGSERQTLAPDVAPAPEGARSPSPNGENYLKSPSVRDALLRRGIRQEQIDAAPSGNMADASATAEFLRVQYDAELHARATAWMAAHPAETEAFGAAARTAMKLPAEKSAPLTPMQRDGLRGAVVESIRQACRWPTASSWDGNEFPPEQSAAA